MTGNRRFHPGVALSALAAVTVLAAASPASAFLDELTSGFLGEEKTEGKQIETFEPATPEKYQSLADLREQGLAIARATANGILPPSPLTEYVNAVLQKLVEASPVPDLPVEVVITPEQGIGAQAMAHGIIEVRWETLERMIHEDELAAILAHELAHLLYRHHEADWIIDLQNTASQTIRLFDQYKGALGKGTGDSLTGVLVSLGAEVTERVIAPNLWSRAQEEEADLLGIDLMVRAGYNAEHALRPLGALDHWQAQNRLALADRRKRQQAARDKEVEDSVVKGDLGNALKHVFGAVVSAAGEATTTIMKEVGGGDHPSTEQRRQRIADYIDREYPATFDVAPRPAPWTRERHPTAAIIANYRRAWDAWALIDSNPKNAEALVRKAVSGPTRKDSWPRIVFATLRQKSKKPVLAEKNLQIALTGEEPGLIVFRSLIQRRVESGRLKDAHRLLDRMSDRLGNPPNLMPYRIALKIDTKKKAEAHILHAECKLRHHEIASICDVAMQGLQGLMSAKYENLKSKSATERLILHEASEKAQELGQQ